MYHEYKKVNKVWWCSLAINCWGLKKDQWLKMMGLVTWEVTGLGLNRAELKENDALYQSGCTSHWVIVVSSFYLYYVLSLSSLSLTLKEQHLTPVEQERRIKPVASSPHTSNQPAQNSSVNKGMLVSLTNSLNSSSAQTQTYVYHWTVSINLS